jgi:DNA helicase II / ATP-dependent DNA helicase PcrA
MSSDSRTHLLEGLNPNQAAAAQHVTGPALVLAGAGAGKTKTLIHRIALLIAEHEVHPNEILAVTFTNKAAAEMRERAGHLVTGASDLWMSTFHSAGVRILRAYGERIGLQKGFLIYDDDDQLDLLKEIMQNLPGLPQDANPRYLRAAIDRAKSNLWGPEEVNTQGEARIAGLPKASVVEGYRRYQARLRSANAIDFSDLLSETVRLFREDPEALERIQRRTRFIQIDEYQDTNTAQYEFAKLLASSEKNIVCIGDPDQCLPPETLIRTATGCIPIEQVVEGMDVYGTGGSLEPMLGKVRFVKKGHFAGPMWEVQAGGRTLRGTPHHLVMARTEPRAGRYYVYLMYRSDRGYRVGMTKSLRANDSGLVEHGFKVRLNQEHGDKIWVLKACSSLAEALYYENFYSAHYGLPTALFHGVGRDLTMDDVWLERLYRELDTASAAQRLMTDLWLHPDFPHHRPQNGMRRQSVNLVMYQDGRNGSGVGYHRIQWCSNRPEIVERLIAKGFPVRSNSKGVNGYRIEVMRKNYADALELTHQIAQAGEMEIQRRAQIGGKIYSFMPLSHLHPGMSILIERNGKLEEADIDAVEQAPYDGPVFDLEVEPTHTYIAGGMLVHNSIYRFRGADIRNILDFQKDYHGAQIYKLEHNYRSSAKVLRAANLLIEHNTERLEKILRPVKPEGEDVAFYRAFDHRGEADYIAQSITSAVHKGRKLEQIAILYRTNAQSRVLEEVLRRNNIAAKIIGGVGFYDRREIKDMLAYVRLALNPRDEVALKRIVGRPRRGIGDSAIQKLSEWAKANKQPLLTAFAQSETILERGAAKAREFYDLIASFAEACDLYDPQHVVKLILDSSGYIAMLQAEGTEGKQRLENLDELLVALTEWSKENEGAGILDFLDEASLLSSVDDARTKRENGGVPEEAVVLMTLHNAKGLEFPEVYVVGVEEGLLPSRNSLAEQGGLEEERRLFYVGITRAMEKLTLTAAENRLEYGKTRSSEDSRFLSELGDSYTQVNAYGEALTKSSRGTHRDYRPTAPAAVVSSQKEKIPLESEFKGGEKVSHPKFGAGTVLAVSGFSDKQQLIVAFESVGNRTLLTKFANLTRV